MCLAIPGKVVKISGRMADVDFGGVSRKVSLEFVDVKKGEYILVHAGFAIEKVDRDVAAEKLKAWSELDA